MLLRIINLLFLLLATITVTFAQNEVPQQLPTTSESPDSLPSYMIPTTDERTADSLSHSTLSTAYQLQKFETTLNAPLNNYNNEFYQFNQISINPGYVGFNVFNGSVLNFSAQTSSLPGFMGNEKGLVSLNQQWGNFSFSAFATITKYGYFRGLQKSYGFGGSMNYRFNNQWAITLFGAYNSPLHPLNMGMAGYMDTPNFGGYLSYDINGNWGINIGAQANRSLVTNRWEAQPIVMPYYKINGKTAIGLDVGGILYNAIKASSEHYNGYNSNPTIGPPIGSPPPIAPHPGK